MTITAETVAKIGVAAIITCVIWHFTSRWLDKRWPHEGSHV